MSVHQQVKQVTIPKLLEMKSKGEKITALTAYDYSFAKILDQAGIEIILVGDSLSMVFAGEITTLPTTMDQMLYHTKIVAKAVKRAMVIGDMPFMSYQNTLKDAINNAARFLKEAGAYGVKIEGGKRNLKLIEKLVEIGIPVMGHLGLTPQSINQFGSYKTRGATTDEAKLILEDSKMLEDVGCFSLVLEKIPKLLAADISKQLKIPTLGIGAGSSCDGQILVTSDMLGLFDDFKPKFVRRYNNLAEQIRLNTKNYIEDVKKQQFPNNEESY
jgi:3-methyl-2-oxobutanoate hydroxymethyltransferase